VVDGFSPKGVETEDDIAWRKAFLRQIGYNYAERAEMASANDTVERPMKRIRFTIASLLVVILFVGVGFAALRESSDLWDSGLFTVTLGILLTSILLAVHRQESKRAFWLGFALFGCGYLGLSLVQPIESRLITTKALTYLDSKVPGRSAGVYTITFAGTGSGSPGNPVPTFSVSMDGSQLGVHNQGSAVLLNGGKSGFVARWSGTTENFVRIGHSLVALLAGWLGAQLSRRFFRTSRELGASTAVVGHGS